MALSHHYRAAAVCVVCAWVATTACRATSLCEQVGCAERVELNGGTAGKGGMVENGGAAGAPSTTDSGAAGRGAAGETSAGGAPDATGATCPDGYGDCDGSEITSCETNLRWYNRHCGVCGNHCEGGCAGGSCLPTLHIADVQALSMVAANTIGFVVVGADSLMKVDIEEGTLHEVASVSSWSSLMLGSDRLYVWDPGHDETSGLSSMPLSATELLSEPAPGIESFGASLEGAYYVEEQNDPETVDDIRKLWFRPRADAPWQLLLEGLDHMELIGSSYAGVVLRRSAPDGPRLSLLEGRDIVDYGLEPEGLREALATGRGLVVLTSDADQYSLSWLREDGSSRHYELASAPTGQDRAMHLSITYSVVMTFSEPAGLFAQEFDENGLVRGRIGLPRTSSVALFDLKFLWHTHLVDELTPRFMRSTWIPSQL